MSCPCCRGQSVKTKACNEHRKVSGTGSCPFNFRMGDCFESVGQQKTKRLKTRRERSQMRGGKTASHHQHHQCKKHPAGVRRCCQKGCPAPPKKDLVFPRMAFVSQEPSIITDSRLIGHQGLFNHEVKSVDIERFLSNQRKLERHQCEEKQGNGSSLSHSTPRNRNPLAENHKGGNGEERQHLTSQGLDITPAQRPQVPEKLCEDEKATTLREDPKGTKVMSEPRPRRDLEWTSTPPSAPPHSPNKMLEPHKITPDQVAENQDPLMPQHTQSPTSSPGPPPLSTRSTDLHATSKSVREAATRLCDSLQFPLLQRRNMAEESRKFLLQVLRERHGAQLKENLLKVQQSLSADHTPAAHQDKECFPADTEQLWTRGSSNTELFSGAQRGAWPSTKGGGLHFSWMPTPYPHSGADQTAHWPMSPDVERMGSQLDDAVRPDTSAPFSVDLEPCAPSPRHHFLPPFASSHWERPTSAPQRWEETLGVSPFSEPVPGHSFEESLVNQTSAARERNSWSLLMDHNTDTCLPHRAGHSRTTGLVLSEARHGLALPTAYIPNYLHERRHLPQPPSQFSLSPTRPYRGPLHTRLAHLPNPSLALDKYPACVTSSRLSPVQWSFLPMRLY